MPLTVLRGVGEKTAPRLHRLGLKTVEDVLRLSLEEPRQCLGARAGGGRRAEQERGDRPWSPRLWSARDHDFRLLRYLSRFCDHRHALESARVENGIARQAAALAAGLGGRARWASRHTAKSRTP